MLRIIAAVVILFVLLTIALQFSSVQTFITGRVVDSVSERTGTPMSIDRLSIRFPKAVSLKGVYVEDEVGDTLLYAGEIRVDVRLLALMRNRLVVNRLLLSDITANLTRLEPDTVFNYDFLVRAFAAEDPSPQEPATEESFEEEAGDPMQFNVNRVNLRNIRFRFADHFSGIDLFAGLGSFSTKVSKLDLEDLKFHLDDTSIKNSRVTMVSRAPSVVSEPDETPGTPPEVDVRSLLLEKISFSMESEGGSSLLASVESLFAEPRQIDLEHLVFDLSAFDLNGGKLEMIGTADPSPTSAVTEVTGEPFVFRWEDIFTQTIIADAFRIRNSEVSLITPQGRKSPKGFDADNLILTGLEMDMENLVASSDTIAFELKNLRGHEAGGLDLKDFSVSLAFGKTTNLTNLNLETAESRVAGNIASSLPALHFSMEDLSRHEIMVDLSQGRVGRDISYFITQVKDYYQDRPELKGLDFAARFNGYIQDLEVDTLWIEGPGYLSTAMHGNVKGLPHAENLELDIPSFFLSARAARISELLPPEMKPQEIRMPPDIQLRAGFKGSFNDFIINMEFRSAFANLDIDATLSNNENPENASWEASLEIDAPLPGAFIFQEELLQDLLASIDLKGRGFDPETMLLKADALIMQAFYNNYQYTNLKLNGEMEGGLLNAILEYEDDNLVMHSENQLALFEEHPRIKTNTILEHFNIQALEFSEDLIVGTTRLDADVVLTRPGFFDGMIRIGNTHMLFEEEVISLDSLLVKTSTENDLFLVEARSEPLALNYSGNISPADIPLAMSKHLNAYFNLPFVETEDTIPHRFFEFNVDVNPSDWYTQFLLPSLSYFSAFSINGSFDSHTSLFSVSTDIPILVYGNMHLRDFSLRGETVPQHLDFALKLPLLETEGMTLRDINLNGHLRDNILQFDLAFNDEEDLPWLRLPGTLESHQRGFRLELEEDLVINRDEWKVSADNYIQFGQEWLLVNNLRVSHQDKYLLAKSSNLESEEDILPPLELVFHHFDLGEFSLEETPIVGGLFNGELVLKDFFKDLAFTSDLSIEKFSFRGDTLGDVEVFVYNPEPWLFSTESSIKGFGNQVDIAGTYNTEEETLDASLQLTRLDLSTLQGFTFGEVTDLTGLARGNLNVSGKTDNPDFSGSLSISDAGFFITFLNAPYRIAEETIDFDRHNVRFSNFTLLDAQGRPASLDGSINLADLSNIVFNLSLTSRNFMALNVAPGQNDLFHGRLLIDTDIRLTGDMVSPLMEGRLGLNEGSRFTFILPQTQPEAIGDEGVVEFISLADTLFVEFMPDPEEEDPFMTAFRNLDISLNVDVDPQTDVRVIIDEYAGDYLEVKGGGLITFGIDPAGRITLTGNYEITDGSYLLTFYDVIRRNFRIQSGSSITWTGDPVEAAVNITAIYNIRTSPRELMESHPGQTGQPDPAFRQMFPFQVFLNMEGELLNPEITFEIGLPPEHRGALDGRLQSRLQELNQNESELNKQVFALLVMGSFIQEAPFAAGATGPGISATARTSASRILSQQLNRMSDRFIRGLDISFEVESYEDFATGDPTGRTELQMEVSRDFLDDRLRVTVGGHIELEDETRRQTNPSDIAGDLTVDYLLNPDGTLILKGFRKRDFGDVFDRELIKTGAALVFSRTYNEFRELFKRKEEEVRVPDRGEIITPDDIEEIEFDPEVEIPDPQEGENEETEEESN